MVTDPRKVAHSRPQLLHTGYPEPVDRRCGQMCGQHGDEQGISGGEPGKTQLTSTRGPRERTLDAHPRWTKKRPRPGKTSFSPASTAPITTTFLYRVNPRNK